MNAYRIWYAQKARTGLRDIAEYIGLDNPQKAEQFIDEITSFIQKTLSVFPHSGRKYQRITHQEIRTIPYGNYVIYYHADKEQQRIDILYVFHAARDIERLLSGEE